jgi:hypothetical protein
VAQGAARRMAWSRRTHVTVPDKAAIRLLHATREQLHGKPIREVAPFEVAEMAGIDPCRPEYDEALRHLLDHGYLEPYGEQGSISQGLYRMTNKGLEEILGNP